MCGDEVSALRKALCGAALAAAVSGTTSGAVFDVREYGAIGDGIVKDTIAIQRALDAAGAAGGGRVTLPPGVYLSGALWLRSGVDLHLEKGAVLKGSTDRADYNADDAFPENFHSEAEEWSGAHLVIGLRVGNVAITGEGTIDGSGSAFFGECDESDRFPWYKFGLRLHPLDRTWFRPGPMVAFFLSKDIRLEGVTLKDTPCWTAHFRCCDGLSIRGVTIDANRTIANSDGFSIDCTRNVDISGCAIRTGDDSFAIRASCQLHAGEHPCENIRIRDCDAWSCCYGVRFGVGNGTIRNVSVENCRFHESAYGIGFTPAWVVEEKNVYIEDITVRNCLIGECGLPVEVAPPKADARVRGVQFENCRMESLEPSRIGGNGVCRAEDFTFSGCSRKKLDALRIAHKPGWNGGGNGQEFANVWPGCDVRFDNCTDGNGTPVPESAFACAYTPEVSATPRLRGVMSPGGDMTEADFLKLEEWGVKIIRFQMCRRNWKGIEEDRYLDEWDRWLNGRLDHFDSFVLPMALRHGMKVALDMHISPGGCEASEENKMFHDAELADHFVETWRRIARRFRGREGIYGYDLVNEPSQKREALPGCDWWNLQRRAAEAVREEDPLTPIIIESNLKDGPSTFADMRPLAISNVIYEVHIYAPTAFTHQRIFDPSEPEVGWPNAEKGWDADFLRDVMKPVREFQLKYRAKIYVGEFSAAAWAPGADQYLRDCIALFEEYGWDWTYHAFRESPIWDVEMEGVRHPGMAPAGEETPRKRALLEGLAR